MPSSGFPWLSFLTYTCISAFTPGPNNILVLSTSGKYGLSKCKAVLFGIFSGFGCVILLCSFFSLTLTAYIPKIMPIMRYIGAAYILWLAWLIARSKPDDDTEKAARIPTFFDGFTLQFVNMKGIVYGISALTGFVMPHYSSTGYVLAFALLLCVISWAGVFTWAVGGVALEKLFSRHSRILNLIMAAALVYCAVSLFL